MRLLGPLIAMLCMFSTPALAQDESIFADYDAYDAFVNERIMAREFVPLLLRLGGRNEYTDEEIEENQAQMRQIWPVDFKRVTVFREVDLGGGVRQEGRLFWGMPVISFTMRFCTSAKMHWWC
ncbi:hypothetical protein [Sulfitobacter aestuariivivens]|uniref:hypothetical protein n=1 Tax=Sulfitobacter aestuariivivens TaxID=2766981 RepID=UPI00360FA3A4